VALVSRADARFLRGGREGLTEEGRVSDDIHGQHDQGGWSQARYERSVDQDEGLGHGERAAAGLDDVLASLNEQRVEALLLDTGLSAPGAQCPACAWIGAVSEGGCPADGTALEPRPNVVNPAIERALAQDARVVRLSERPELESHGGIAAVLRF
jgi:peptide subunit release factor 1 (eRF1)